MDSNRNPDPEPDAGTLVDEGLGVGSDPLRPDEREAYRTDPTAGDGRDDDTTVATDSRGWIVVGIVLLMVFIVVLVWGGAACRSRRSGVGGHRPGLTGHGTAGRCP